MKRCSKCGVEKKLEEFGRASRERDGHKSACKECLRAQSRAYSKTPEARAKGRETTRRYRERNPEKAREANRRSYAKHSEKRRAEMAEWRKNNPEKQRAAERRWREANREVKLELQREYAKRHPEKVLANARRQEMRRRGNGLDPDSESREYMAIIRNDRCCYCGGPVEEIDHIEADRDAVVNGWNHWENLTAACKSCNCRKYQLPLLQFLLR